MSCTPAPTCLLALHEATLIAPRRDHASDGICPGPHHPQTGDHPRGNAFDVDHDPAAGWDNFVRAEELRAGRDGARVKYVIFFGRMFASYSVPLRSAWTWGPYSGPNAHHSHMHVSIKAAARDDMRPWWAPGGKMLIQQPGTAEVWELVGSQLFYVNEVSYAARGRPRPVAMAETHDVWRLPRVR